MSSSLNNPNPRNSNPVEPGVREVQVSHDDEATREAVIGTVSGRRTSNVSWGSVFAGVVTFLALTIVLNLITAALSLNNGAGVGAGIWTIISLAIALAAAGYVAGALAIQSGLLHGFLTWATSILAILILAGWFGGTLLGAVGNLAGSVADQINVSQGQVANVIDAAQQNSDQAKQAAAKAADAASAAAWWSFAGALIGGIIAAATGVWGARTVIRRKEDVVVVNRA